MYLTKQKIHCIGIGGAGMSGIAEVLHRRGFIVTGSDSVESDICRKMGAMGISIQYGHQPDLIKGAELAIFSSAVKPSNPERQYATEKGIVQIRRAEVLGDMTRGGDCIAIAGTHGKTTTTAMAGLVFATAGLQPTVIVGGMLKDTKTNAVVGSESLTIVEADEYDRSFLALSPTAAIVTNIEADHLDCYKDIQDIEDTFVKFCNQVPFYGLIVACIDSPHAARVLPGIQRRVVTCGIAADADYCAVDIRSTPIATEFKVKRFTVEIGTITLGVPGIHNVKNALAVIALACELGISFDKIAAGCAAFTGVGRRFDVLGVSEGVTIIDDYAHHPTEIAATIQAAQSRGFGKVGALFQPHLYSRTRDLMADFATSLSAADVVVVTGIYKSREEPIAGVSAQGIVDLMIKSGHTNVRYIENKESAAAAIATELVAGDVCVVMGAGDITAVAEKMAQGVAHAGA